MNGFAKYSGPNIANEFRYEYKLPIARLALYTPWNRATLERILNGLRLLSHDEEQQLIEIVKELRALQELYPIRLDFSDTENVIALLKKNRANVEQDQLARDVIQQEKASQVRAPFKIAGASVRPKPVSTEQIEEIARQLVG